MPEKKKHILLVEDDPAILDIYQTTIEKGGFNVQIANSGQGAIKIIKEASSGDLPAQAGQPKPDLVLLDLILPDVNGLEVLKEIRSNAATKDMKVFILTNQERTATELLEGITPDQFIIKANTAPSELLDLIKKELE